MATKEGYSKHYEKSIRVNSHPEDVFAYADDHNNFSSHMNKSSWVMGGGNMETHLDEGKGQKIGSHIKMHGKVFGTTLYLDEVITKHEPPHNKEWQTIGDLNLLVIDHYKLGFVIKPDTNATILRAYIDYNLPQSTGTRLLGLLLGRMYAKWCVNQMISNIKTHFKGK